MPRACVRDEQDYRRSRATPFCGNASDRHGVLGGREVSVNEATTSLNGRTNDPVPEIGKWLRAVLIKIAEQTRLAAAELRRIVEGAKAKRHERAWGSCGDCRRPPKLSGRCGGAGNGAPVVAAGSPRGPRSKRPAPTTGQSAHWNLVRRDEPRALGDAHARHELGRGAASSHFPRGRSSPTRRARKQSLRPSPSQAEEHDRRAANDDDARLPPASYRAAPARYGNDATSVLTGATGRCRPSRSSGRCSGGASRISRRPSRKGLGLPRDSTRARALAKRAKDLGSEGE